MMTDEDRKERYKKRIQVIKDYYGVSDEAAVYIYFRRKRSYPWKKKSDPKYLFWNAKLQNALIEADSIVGFDWMAMQYGKEEETLLKYGIDIVAQSQNLFRPPTTLQRERTYLDENGLEWEYATVKRRQSERSPEEREQITVLQSIGLIPKFNNLFM
jgi:hypothetical protein